MSMLYQGNILILTKKRTNINVIYVLLQTKVYYSFYKESELEKGIDYWIRR